jgi:hypothetical protein
MQEIDRKLLDLFINHAKEQKESESDLLKVILCKNVALNRYGFLYVAQYSETLDNHCEQCKYEQPLFFGLKGDEDFPNYFAGEIGPTKYQRILDKEIDMNPAIEFLFDLLEQ